MRIVRNLLLNYFLVHLQMLYFNEENDYSEENTVWAWTEKNLW